MTAAERSAAVERLIDAILFARMTAEVAERPVVVHDFDRACAHVFADSAWGKSLADEVALIAVATSTVDVAVAKAAAKMASACGAELCAALALINTLAAALADATGTTIDELLSHWGEVSS